MTRRKWKVLHDVVESCQCGGREIETHLNETGVAWQIGLNQDVVSFAMKFLLAAS